MAFGGLPFPGTGYPVPDVADIHISFISYLHTKLRIIRKSVSGIATDFFLVVFGDVCEPIAFCVVVQF